jgi:hypothetical protein
MLIPKYREMVDFISNDVFCKRWLLVRISELSGNYPLISK